VCSIAATMSPMPREGLLGDFERGPDSCKNPGLTYFFGRVSFAPAVAPRLVGHTRRGSADSVVAVSSMRRGSASTDSPTPTPYSCR
jgi:hypothetical protein